MFTVNVRGADAKSAFQIAQDADHDYDPAGFAGGIRSAWRFQVLNPGKPISFQSAYSIAITLMRASPLAVGEAGCFALDNGTWFFFGRGA